jgi:PST family polysaccharide transporter
MLAEPLAGLLGAPAAVPAIQLMAASTLIGGVGAVPGAILVRDLRQRAKFAVDATSFVAGTAVLMALAILGFGAMALAWSRVANQCASLVCLSFLNREWYRPGFNRQAYTHVIRLGLPVAGASLVGFAVGNVDNGTVSRARGAHELGLYSQAFNISGWPVALFTAMVDSITVPTLARLRDRPSEFLRHLRSAVAVLALVASLSAALISALAAPLVDLLLGERWASAAPALQILAWFGAARVLIALFSDSLVALRQTRRLLLLNILWVLLLIPSMIWASERYGMIGAAACHVVVAALVMLPLFWIAVCRSGSIAARSIVQSMWLPLVGGAASWCAATWAIQLTGSTVLRLILGLSIGAVVFGAVTGHWIVRRLLPEFREIYAVPRASDGKGRRRRGSLDSSSPAVAASDTSTYEGGQ